MSTTTLAVLAAVALCAAAATEYKSCRYYCGYADETICCDDGSLPIPPNHDPHAGRCPIAAEIVCKNNVTVLHYKATKLAATASGSRQLSEKGGAYVLCASDGYCKEDERCCPSQCPETLVCLKALYTKKDKEQKQTGQVLPDKL